MLVVSIILGFCIYTWLYNRRKNEALAIAKVILQQSEEKANQLYHQMTEKLKRELEYQKKTSFQWISEARENNQNLEQRLDIQTKDIEIHEARLQQMEEYIQKKTAELLQLQNTIKTKETTYKTLQANSHKILLEISGETEEKLKKEFLCNFEKVVQTEFRVQYNRHIDYLNANAERTARRILSAIIQRCQFSHWIEAYPSFFSIEDESFAQEITSEKITKILQENLDSEDIYLEYDENYKILSIVSPDGCCREICRQIIQKLIDYKLNPEQCIQELLEQSKEEMENAIIVGGDQACILLQLHFHEDIRQLLGRLKFRTSFGQNVLWHSIEVAYLAKLIASEIGLDKDLACRAGFLHDIGKALDHEKEGGHPEIGGEIISKFNEAPEIIEGIVGHHNDIQLETMYATLINTADAISASRPGARRETFEKYINRLEKLESIAYNVPGIENAFAISAGREIRVIVNPEEISDKETSVVAQKIAKEIEKELHYPGKIKITVVREMKIVEYAH